MDQYESDSKYQGGSLLSLVLPMTSDAIYILKKVLSLEAPFEKLIYACTQVMLGIFFLNARERSAPFCPHLNLATPCCSGFFPHQTVRP